MERWLSLSAGGLAGVASRYLLAAWVYRAAGTDFPYGTLIVNVSGCFLIGVFDSLAEVRFLLGPNLRLLLMTGFCGGYTTFSTLILETSNLLKDGETARALVNFLGSGALGFVLFRLGAWLAAVI